MVVSPTDMNECVRAIENVDSAGLLTWEEDHNLAHCSWSEVEALPTTERAKGLVLG